MAHNPRKRRQQRDQPDSSSGSDNESKSPSGKKATHAKAAIGGNWRTGLLSSMSDPEAKVFEDDRVVVIKDKYPKARYHFLVMSIEKIDHLQQLRSKHVELLEHMNAVGRNIAAEHAAVDQFRFGFHERPSMARLHMHVVSEDFDSPCLKTKKHWNSFTTEFFRDFDDILNELKNNGKIAAPSGSACDEMLKRPLKCHKCEDGTIFPTLPKLKEHLKMHSRKSCKNN